MILFLVFVRFFVAFIVWLCVVGSIVGCGVGAIFLILHAQ